MSQPPSQAAVEAAQLVKDLFLMRHWAHVAEEEIAAIIDRHIPATDRAGWQGMEEENKEMKRVLDWLEKNPDKFSFSKSDHGKWWRTPFGYKDERNRFPTLLALAKCHLSGEYRRLHAPSAPRPTKV